MVYVASSDLFHKRNIKLPDIVSQFVHLFVRLWCFSSRMPMKRKCELYRHLHEQHPLEILTNSLRVGRYAHLEKNKYLQQISKFKRIFREPQSAQQVATYIALYYNIGLRHLSPNRLTLCLPRTVHTSHRSLHRRTIEIAIMVP